MIELSKPTETRVIQAAKAAGVNISEFLDRLLDEYVEDKQDIEQAELAMKEEGGISLQDFRSRHGV